MNPIDAGNYGRGSGGPGSNTMKAIDDEMRDSASSTYGSWGNVLENVVVIPANDAVGRVDDRNATYHVGGTLSTKSLPNGAGGILVQRRYVQPASPFDVLYGAAFLHSEADRVEAQHRLKSNRKQKIRSSPNKYKRKKKKKTSTMKAVMEAMNGQRSKDTIRPMMTISEVDDTGTGAGEFAIEEVISEEDEDEYDSDGKELESTNNDFSQLGPGELRHNASSMSFYSPSNFMRNLSEKYNLGLFEPIPNSVGDFEHSLGNGTGEPALVSEKENDSIEPQDFPVEEGVVFKDFPRHDGTPCLIYNSKEKETNTYRTTETVAAQQSPVKVQTNAVNDDSIFDEDVSRLNPPYF